MRMEGTDEVAQWLRALVSLPEDLVSISGSTWKLTTVCNSSPKEPSTHMCVDTHFR